MSSWKAIDYHRYPPPLFSPPRGLGQPLDCRQMQEIMMIARGAHGDRHGIDAFLGFDMGAQHRIFILPTDEGRQVHRLVPCAGVTAAARRRSCRPQSGRHSFSAAMDSWQLPELWAGRVPGCFTRVKKPGNSQPEATGRRSRFGHDRSDLKE